jgi:hypothetical protein
MHAARRSHLLPISRVVGALPPDLELFRNPPLAPLRIQNLLETPPSRSRLPSPLLGVGGLPILVRRGAAGSEMAVSPPRDDVFAFARFPQLRNPVPPYYLRCGCIVIVVAPRLLTHVLVDEIKLEEA